MGDGASSSTRARRTAAGSQSVVIDHGLQRSSCGYCRASSSSISHGVSAVELTAYDYQDLLDRGWRRSGCYLYKPEMEQTCCPSYTIRLRVKDFFASKDQSRVLKRMQRYLDGEIDSTGQNLSSRKLVKAGDVSSKNFLSVPAKMMDDDLAISWSKKLNDALDVFLQERVKFPADVQVPKASVKKVGLQLKKKLHEDSANLSYTSSVGFQISAFIRKHNAALGQSCSPESIAEELVKIMERHCKMSDIFLKGCNGHLNIYSTSGEATTSEVISSNLPLEVSKTSTHTRDPVTPHKRRKLEFRMKPSRFDPEEFTLYRKYQMRVHNDKIVTESSYRRFLVDTPIHLMLPKKGDNTIPRCGYGSFHQQYRIDGKLVAVGVVDVLPRCLSSKYLFWDPDLAFLSLGKYSALREISWVRETEAHCPGLQYYYLGYYIHSCSKMRYKAAYRPSQLLCPVRYEWVPYDIAKPLLDKKPYVILSENTELQDAEAPLPPDSSGDQEEPCSNDSDDEEDYLHDNFDMDVDDCPSPRRTKCSTARADDLSGVETGEIMMEISGRRVQFKELTTVFGPQSEKAVKELEVDLQVYVKAVGQELADRMIYSLS